MYHYNQKTCNNICEKNVAIHTLGKEAVAHLELCGCDCNRNGVLYGRVINQFGQPVKDAVVKIVSEVYEPVLITKTDSMGNYFIFTVPPNRPYKAIAVAENCDLSDEVKICIKERGILKLDIPLSCNSREDRGVLTGTVLRKSDALPIDKAQVMLFEEVGGATHFRSKTETNAFGQFALTRLALGTYRVQISMGGYISAQYRVRINCGQIINLVASLRPDTETLKGTVSGVIINCQKEPIADADVILYKVEGDNKSTPIAYTKTNSNGVYLFINVEVGYYKVLAK